MGQQGDRVEPEVVEGGNLLCEMIIGGRDRVEPEEAEGGAQCACLISIWILLR